MGDVVDYAGGDMFKSVYDTNNDGIVDKADDSEKLEGSTKAEVQNHNPKTHTHSESEISDLDHNAQKIKDKSIDAPVEADDGKVLAYDHDSSKYKNAPICFSFAIPIDTPETVANDKGVFAFAPGVAGTIEEVYVMAKTAPGADKTLTVDVNKGGTTIFTTQGNRPSLVDTATEATSGTPDVTTFAKNDKFTIDVDISTADTAIADVVVLIRGKQKVV